MAVDVADEKLALARSLGADAALDARAPGLVADVLAQTKGWRPWRVGDSRVRAGVRSSPQMVRRKGTVCLVALPPGEFLTPIFDVVLKRITIRGSIVGTRKDLAEALAFAADGKVTSHIHRTPLEGLNEAFEDLKTGRVDGRMVLDISQTP